MHSNTEAMASQSFAMHRTNAAAQAANGMIAAFDQFATQVTLFASSYVAARRRHKAMVETISMLSHLDDHQLRDIGVERGQIASVARQAVE